MSGNPLLSLGKHTAATSSTLSADASLLLPFQLVSGCHGAAPEVVVLMPCGFALERTIEEHARAPRPPEWSGLPAVQGGQVYAGDGSAYFNRPGPRIVTGVRMLAEILHPGRFPRTTPPDAWRRLG